MRTRILIDGIAISHPQPGGYKTYATDLVQSLAAIDATNDYILAVDRPVAGPATPDWRIEVLGRAGSLGVIWREQVALPRFARQEGVDLVHAPAATAGAYAQTPLVLTLHDTIEFTDPLPSPRQTKRWAMRIYSRYAQANAARKAAHVITVSNYSKRKIQELLGVPAERLSVIYEAPSSSYRQLEKRSAVDAIQSTYGVSNYVLALASAAKRKNTRGLIEAYAALPITLRDRHPLLLVCTHQGVREQLQVTAATLGLGDQVSFAEKVTDAELLLLYNAAALFAFPSLEEGFGLPVLEAMACGVPVVASNSSSLPEVVGDAGVLVEPGDTTGLAAAIENILSDPTQANSMHQRGLQHVQQFSWSATAKHTLEVYRTVADGYR